VQLWKSPVEDDGVAETSEPTLHQRVDELVSSAVRLLGRAVSSRDPGIQLRSELLLEVARAFRSDIRQGTWSRLSSGRRRQLRDAVLALESYAETGRPLPVA